MWVNPIEILKLYKMRRVPRKIYNFFDPKYYLSQFSEFERKQISDPLVHFLTYWDQNGFDPNPFFSMADYRLANPDVAASNVNPLIHFIKRGKRENRPLVPDRKRENIMEGDAENEVIQQIKFRQNSIHPISDLGDYLDSIGVEFSHEPNLIDEEYYRSYFPDEVLSDCQSHYNDLGWKKGLNPTPWFNTKFYLKNYDDVARAGVNPFYHFTQQGFLENRLPNSNSLELFLSVLDGKSVEDEARLWVNRNRSYKYVDLSTVEKQISNGKISDAGFVVSIGHSRYLQDIGGIQLYLYHESVKFNKLKLNYLYLSPSVPLPILADQSQNDLYLNITFNNKQIVGDVALSDIPALISRITTNKIPEAFIINSLYGWHPELLVHVINQIRPKNSFWMFHDYSSFCTNARLSFEDAKYCDNPKLEAAICSTCRYGRTRASYVSRITLLREARDWKLVTPSWSTSTNVSKYLQISIDQITTLPHGRLTDGDKRRSFAIKPRIAYVGHPVVAKGWLHYKNFVNLGLKEFDFFHFGSVDVSEPGISYSHLTNRFTEPNRSRDLLVEYQIDAVFICPTWQETFCFVAYEALAAGCQIICNSGSGNVVEASLSSSILLDEISSAAITRVKDEILTARKMKRYISEFNFTGTIASEFSK